MVLGNPHFCFGAGHEQEFSQSSDDQPADAGCAHDDIVPLNYIEYGIYGGLIIIYPKPYSIYLRGNIKRLKGHCQFKTTLADNKCDAHRNFLVCISNINYSTFVRADVKLALPFSAHYLMCSLWMLLQVRP